MHCAQMGHCGPHLHNSSDGTFGTDMVFWVELHRTIVQGIIAYFGGAFSASGLSILMMVLGFHSHLGKLAMSWQQINLLKLEQCWAME